MDDLAIAQRQIIKMPVRRLPGTAQLDADATRIRASADQVVEKILERRDALDRAGRQDEILAVAAGEIHYMPSHHAHHMAVLDGLTRHANVAFGYEYHHNLVAQDFALINKGPLSEAALDYLRARDRNGELSLKTCMIYSSDFAGQSHFILHRFLLNRGIPTRFTDAAMTDDGNLDATDPSTALSLRAVLGRILSGVSNVSASGMHGRNHHMAAKGIDFAQQIGANILYQQCGVAHATGDGPDGLRGIHSLSTQFKKRGAHVLALPVLGPIFTRASIPNDHGLAKNERLVLNDLPTTSALYDYPSGPLPGTRSDLHSNVEEAAYLNGLLERLGLESEIITLKTQVEEKYAHIGALGDTLKACPAAPVPA